jgi:hypothetical protein
MGPPGEEPRCPLLCSSHATDSVALCVRSAAAVYVAPSKYVYAAAGKDALAWHLPEALARTAALAVQRAYAAYAPSPSSSASETALSPAAAQLLELLFAECTLPHLA